MPGQPKVVLLHGNNAEALANARFELRTAMLPGGEADGEFVDIRPPGNMPLSLERAFSEIVQELGTVSLIPDQKRVVTVWQLNDFREDGRGSVRAQKKTKAEKRDVVAEFGTYLRNSLPDSPNHLIFVFEEDDEKGRKVSKSSSMYQLVRDVGEIREFSEKRLDWQLDDTLLAGDLSGSVRLIREWTDRGGNAPFRLVATLNGFLQLLLQARLEAEARRAGTNTKGLFGSGMWPSLESVPEFKARKVRALAGTLPLERIRRALGRLNEAQRSLFPTGNELVVHDGIDQVEVMLVELLDRRA